MFVFFKLVIAVIFFWVFGNTFAYSQNDDTSQSIRNLLSQRVIPSREFRGGATFSDQFILFNARRQTSNLTELGERIPIIWNRSLIITNPEVKAAKSSTASFPITFRKVMESLAERMNKEAQKQGAIPLDTRENGRTLFSKLWTAGTEHCSNTSMVLKEYECGLGEVNLAVLAANKNISDESFYSMFTIRAVVNRFDLADRGTSPTCGEYRIIAEADFRRFFLNEDADPYTAANGSKVDNSSRAIISFEFEPPNTWLDGEFPTNATCDAIRAFFVGLSSEEMEMDEVHELLGKFFLDENIFISNDGKLVPSDTPMARPFGPIIHPDNLGGAAPWLRGRIATNTLFRSGQDAGSLHRWRYRTYQIRKSSSDIGWNVLPVLLPDTLNTSRNCQSDECDTAIFPPFKNFGSLLEPAYTVVSLGRKPLLIDPYWQLFEQNLDQNRESNLETDLSKIDEKLREYLEKINTNGQIEDATLLERLNLVSCGGCHGGANMKKAGLELAISYNGDPKPANFTHSIFDPLIMDNDDPKKHSVLMDKDLLHRRCLLLGGEQLKVGSNRGREDFLSLSELQQLRLEDLKSEKSDSPKCFTKGKVETLFSMRSAADR